MKLTILCVILLSTCWAQQQDEQTAIQHSSRAPQGQVQYSDPDGSKVAWRLYAPYTQWKSHLKTPQRNTRAESDTVHPRSEFLRADVANADVEKRAIQQQQQQQQNQAVQPQQIDYKPFSMVPTHIKQLLLHMYQPQQPYIDPAVYVYQSNQAAQQVQQNREEQEKRQASSSEQDDSNDDENNNDDESVEASGQSTYSTGLYEHIPKYQSKYPVGKSKHGHIKYKTESASESPRYGIIPNKRQQQSVGEDNGPPQLRQGTMPHAIHQLLALQAQTPYHVIADRIVYKPKSIFVPKPFTDEAKGPAYKYRSKVYYLKNDGYEPESKERTERDDEQAREQTEEE